MSGNGSDKLAPIISQDGKKGIFRNCPVVDAASSIYGVSLDNAMIITSVLVNCCGEDGRKWKYYEVPGKYVTVAAHKGNEEGQTAIKSIYLTRKMFYLFVAFILLRNSLPFSNRDQFLRTKSTTNCALLLSYGKFIC